MIEENKDYHESKKRLHAIMYGISREAAQEAFDEFSDEIYKNIKRRHAEIGLHLKRN